MYAVSGILFNHESPRREAEFVSRKISLGVAKVKPGYESKIRLGKLSARRTGVSLAITHEPCS